MSAVLRRPVERCVAATLEKRVLGYIFSMQRRACASWLISDSARDNSFVFAAIVGARAVAVIDEFLLSARAASLTPRLPPLMAQWLW